MNYEDEELAEAALLLAHTHDDVSLPPALEEKLDLLAKKHATEARYTTTKAAAVVVEPPVVTAIAPRSRLGSWAGWIAAAACFAIVVYQWRVRTLESAARLERAARPTRIMVLTDRDGHEIASIAAEPATGVAELEIASLPDAGPGARYRVWVSSGAAAPATVGDLTCDDGCKGRTFSFPALPALPASAEIVWITRVGADAGPGFPGDAGDGIVASGHRP